MKLLLFSTLPGKGKNVRRMKKTSARQGRTISPIGHIRKDRVESEAWRVEF